MSLSNQVNDYLMRILASIAPGVEPELSTDGIVSQIDNAICGLLSELSASQYRECALREALKPFADEYETYLQAPVDERPGLDSLPGIKAFAEAHSIYTTAPPCQHQQRAEELAAVLEAKNARQFPIQRGVPVPWAEAEKAYITYAKHFGTQQSLDDLARRGGFGVDEFLHLYLNCPIDCEKQHDWINFDQAARDARMRADGAEKELERLINDCGEHAGILVDKYSLRDRIDELRKGTGRG